MTLATTLYPIVRGKDSILDLPLTENNALVPSDGISRCDLVFKREGVADFTVSSSTHPTWFSLQEPIEIDGVSLNAVRINLRQLGDPPADARYRVDVYLYDQDFPNGRYWGTLDVEVRPAPPAP